MTTLAALILLVPADPSALLKEAAKHYAGLKRFEATLVHHNDSGLFPGDYTQKLVWTGKGKFTLKVTKAATPRPGRAGAPDYTADGTNVVTKKKDGTTSSESVIPRANSMPGWEVSGGLILSLLEKTDLSRMVLSPGADFPIVWKVGSAKKWQNIAVRELIGTMKGKAFVSTYFDPKAPKILGFSTPSGGWMMYKDAKEG